jgi:hypothetical protein
MGYLLGNLCLKGIDPNHSQSREIEDFVSLGQELEQLEKPPNRVRFKGDFLTTRFPEAGPTYTWQL